MPPAAGSPDVDPARVQRYADKLDHAARRLGQVEEWLVGADRDAMPRLATYKAFQEVAEACADLASMMTIDSGRAVKDDHRNFEVLAEMGLVPPRLVPKLAEATGLRNRLVHEYNGLDDARALRSIRTLTPALRSFLEEVERWFTSRK